MLVYSIVDLAGSIGGNWPVVSSSKLTRLPHSLCDPDSDEPSPSANEEFLAMDDGTDMASCAAKTPPLIAFVG